MSTEDITPEERRDHAKYMALSDQVFAWALENETEIIEMVVSKEFTDDQEFLSNLGIVAIHALIRYKADILKENM